MYFVDRQKIEEILTYMEKLIHDFEMIKKDNPIERYATERVVQMTIESILDVGNMIIDGFIMRDPGSYEDIIDILHDEKVIADENAKGLKEVISYRKNLVQQYLNIEHDTLEKVFNENQQHIQSFPQKVRDYLNNELGPVSAFIK